MIVARRYHFVAEHHIPGLPGYDKPHTHRYTVEIVARSDDRDYYDTQNLDDWWGAQPDHEGADLNRLYESTTVEWIAQRLLNRARGAGLSVTSVTVMEDDDRWARAQAI